MGALLVGKLHRCWFGLCEGVDIGQGYGIIKCLGVGKYTWCISDAEVFAFSSYHDVSL